MTNSAFGFLYVGVTNDVTPRVREHKDGAIPSHTRRYRLKRLVFAERHESILSAIQREKNIKTGLANGRSA